MDQNLIVEQAKAIASLLRSLMRELGAGLQDQALDLPLAQLRVCGVLRTGPRSMSALGRELGVSLSAVTQIADRLERAKLVDRMANGDDRRIRSLQLTKRGKSLLRLHDEDRIRRAAAMLRQLTPEAREEAAAVIEMLGRAAAAARSLNRDHGPVRPRNSKSKENL